MTQSGFRLRIHLSTALILSFAAAGLIWLNTVERRTPHSLYVSVSGDNMRHMKELIAQGWPFTVTKYIPQNIPYSNTKEPHIARLVLEIEPTLIVANVAIGCIILLVLAFVIEAVIYFRGVQKKVNHHEP